MGYNGGMIETAVPLGSEPCTSASTPDHALLEQMVLLRREIAALRAENAVLQTRLRELEARLGQDSSDSSRPPSSDPPPVPPEGRATPSSPDYSPAKWIGGEVSPEEFAGVAGGEVETDAIGQFADPAGDLEQVQP